MGIIQRGGRVYTTTIPDASRHTLLPIIRERVLPSSIVYTDERRGYRRLPKLGYDHRRIHHSLRVYVMGDIHTNTIEGFWSLVKRGLDGVHHAVSAKYLQQYFNA